MEKKERLNLSFGNKGFILTLDATLAVLVVLIILAVASFYFVQSYSLLPVFPVKRGHDIIAVLDYSGTLSKLNKETIAQEISSSLPLNLEMKIQISGNFSEHGGLIEVGNDIPGDKEVWSGQRVTPLIKNNKITNFSKISFWIWQK